MEEDQQFVEYVLKSVVDNPDDVRVDRTIDDMGVLISVNVNPEDMGKVIGKSGQTAKAIRTLLKVVGAKNDARVNMKIIEPEGGTGGHGARNDAPADATASDSDDQEAGSAPNGAAATTGGQDAFGSVDEIPQPTTDTDDTPAFEPQPGTTEAADDVPVQEESVAEAVAEQTQTDAAVPQPSENDEIVDEATGDRVSDEPLTSDDAPTDAPGPDDTDASQSRSDDLTQQRERSPLDDL